MPFSSLTFVLVFFPVLFLIYCAAGRKARNAVLLIGSLVFYAWGSFRFLWLILAECVIGWAAGLAMERDRSHARWYFALSMLLILSALFWFKYANFVFQQLSYLGMNFPLTQTILLPAGISFYTFQILSYLIDVCHQKHAPQRSLWTFSLYICMFFQLIAGPIVRYGQIESQLGEKKLTWASMAQGAGRFVCGLAKKVLLANGLYALQADIFSQSDPGVLVLWTGAAAGMLFVYFDFSGYSDMAIGLGRMMGWQLPENFQYPLIQLDFTHFWRCWHMSLTGWLRDYIYIPLGGSRHGTARTLLAMGVVWLCTGLWHGAAWTFVIWGALFFALLALEKFVLSPRVKKSVLYRVFFLLVLIVSFVLFQSGSILEFCLTLKRLAGQGSSGALTASGWYLLRDGAVLLGVSLLACFPTGKRWHARLSATSAGSWMMVLAQMAVFVVCIAFLAYGSWNPFLYFRF